MPKPFLQEGRIEGGNLGLKFVHLQALRQELAGPEQRAELEGHSPPAVLGDDIQPGLSLDFQRVLGRIATAVGRREEIFQCGQWRIVGEMRQKGRIEQILHAQAA